jgi:hypothetical protein
LTHGSSFYPLYIEAAGRSQLVVVAFIKEPKALPTSDTTSDRVV